MQPEPWHPSHGATADRAYRVHDVVLLRAALLGAGLALEAKVLARLPELHARYVRCT